MTVAERLGLRTDELAGQVAVITGAGRGIGREAALALAALGARVVVAEIDDEAGNETVALIRAAGGTAAFVRTDVSLEADVSKLAMWTLADFGPADILINNAILSPVASLMEMEPDLFDRVIAVNLRGAFLTCRAFVPGMLMHNRGVIVNMISADAMANMSAYIASKQGLTGFSQSLHAELSHEGIKVIPFAPGFVHTPGLLAAGERLAPRMGLTPEEFARLSFHPAYSGMMPAADAGAATVFLIARLADDYAGEVVTGYTVLERAGVIPPSGTAAAAESSVVPAAEPATREKALVLSRALGHILAETETEFGRLPIFVRPIAKAGFKSKAGQSLQDWTRMVETLAGALEAGRPVSPDLIRMLGRLMAYYQGVPGETARFTRDEAVLREITETCRQRERVIQELIAALSGLVA